MQLSVHVNHFGETLSFSHNDDEITDSQSTD